MNKVHIFAKNNEYSTSLKEKLLNLFPKYGFVEDENNPELVIAIGGDGTFLRCVHAFKDQDVYLLGIKTGTLGFFYDFDDNLEDILLKIKNNDFRVSEYRLLEADIDKDKTIYALNEIRIENPFHTLTCDVYINDFKLETFRGNGLVVCSPIGSSAYNKSLGGAIIDTSLEVMELTEIATIQNNVYRSLGSSLIVSGDTKIEFRGDLNNLVIGYDFDIMTLANSKEISFTLSHKSIKIIHDKDSHQIHKLKESFIK